MTNKYNNPRRVAFQRDARLKFHNREREEKVEREKERAQSEHASHVFTLTRVSALLPTLSVATLRRARRTTFKTALARDDDDNDDDDGTAGWLVQDRLRERSSVNEG